MPMWRCPHCRTPQAEAARCWVCHRSSTACGTCRHFRQSVAAQIGYCGLDRQRLALRGDEIRPCWEAPAPKGAEATPPVAIAGTGGGNPRTNVRILEFVPVSSAASAAPTDPEAVAKPRARVRRPPAGVDTAPRDPAALGTGPAEARWSLWSELEA